MNTATQQQMTIERNAPGLSLLVGALFASLESIASIASIASTATTAIKRLANPRATGQRAAASLLTNVFYSQRADQGQRHESITDGFDSHRSHHAHHIRGGNP